MSGLLGLDSGLFWVVVGEPTGLFLTQDRSMSGLGLFIMGGVSCSSFGGEPGGLLQAGGKSMSGLGLFIIGGLSFKGVFTVGDATGLFLEGGTSISGLGLLIIGGDSSPELSLSPDADKGPPTLGHTGLLARDWKLTGPLACLGEHIGLLASEDPEGLLSCLGELTGLRVSLGDWSGLLTKGGGLLRVLSTGEKLVGGFGEEGLL